MFDTEAIKNMETTSSGDVNYVPIPESTDGNGWRAVIQAFDLTERQNDKINDGKPFLELSVEYLFDEEKLREVMQREEVKMKHNLILDIVQDGNGNITGLDMTAGKNVQLNRLRSATNLNEEGKPFKFSMLVGKALRVWPQHTPRKDGEGVYVNVGKVGPVNPK